MYQARARLLSLGLVIRTCFLCDSKTVEGFFWFRDWFFVTFFVTVRVFCCGAGLLLRQSCFLVRLVFLYDGVCFVLRQSFSFFGGAWKGCLSSATLLCWCALRLLCDCIFCCPPLSHRSFTRGPREPECALRAAPTAFKRPEVSNASLFCGTLEPTRMRWECGQVRVTRLRKRKQLCKSATVSSLCTDQHSPSA